MVECKDDELIKKIADFLNIDYQIIQQNGIQKLMILIGIIILYLIIISSISKSITNNNKNKDNENKNNNNTYNDKDF